MTAKEMTREQIEIFEDEDFYIYHPDHEHDYYRLRYTSRYGYEILIDLSSFGEISTQWSIYVDSFNIDTWNEIIKKNDEYMSKTLELDRLIDFDEYYEIITIIEHKLNEIE